MKQKVCKNCRLIVHEAQCPLCKGNKFVDNFKGKIIIVDPVKSEIAEKMGFKAKGDYAIKI